MSKRLTKTLMALGVAKADEKSGIMLAYMRLVLEQSKVMNLTAIQDEEEFLSKHLIDSLSCLGRSEIDGAEKIVDIGTGAGFPGVPLAVCYPEKSFLLIDSLGKRMNFITESCVTLGIDNVRALHMRAEDAGQDKSMRENADIVVSRAVAHLSVLCEYCLPLVKVGGAFFAYKTARAEGEIAESKKALFLLGAAPNVEVYPPVSVYGAIGRGKAHGTDDIIQKNGADKIMEKSSEICSGRGAGNSADKAQGDRPSENNDHVIFIISKERKTPHSYPRKAGTPAKMSL